MNETLVNASCINESKHKNFPPLSWNGILHFRIRVQAVLFYWLLRHCKPCLIYRALSV